jgi:hypothetical protein
MPMPDRGPVQAASPLVLLLCGSVTWAVGTGDGGKTAALRLQSQPTGAEVFLDGRTRGKTPLDLRGLTPGLRALTLKKDGFVPLALQVYLPDKARLHLGTLPLARQGSVITFWRVGSPFNAAVPPAAIPKDLEALVKSLGFRVKVLSFPARTFPAEFRKAFQEAGGVHLPDVIAGDNHGPFGILLADRTIAPRLRTTAGVLTMIDPFVYLVARSPGHAAARYVALSTRGRATRHFSWSLREEKLKDLPGRLRPAAERVRLEELSYRAMAAYVTGDMRQAAALLHNDMLGRTGAFGDRSHQGTVAGMRPLYVLGNRRLAFVLATVSSWNEDRLGCMEVLLVWVKARGRWSLLTITWDPVARQTATEGLPRLAGALGAGQGQAVLPAALLTPLDGQLARAFRWTPSPSQGVVAEIAEFNYGRASRLFCPTRGAVSAGQLWTTDGPWSWRVWSIGKDGQVVLSEVRHFRH